MSDRAPVPGSRDVNLLGRIKGVTITPVGLEISGDMSFEQWQDIGKRLGRVNDRFQWFIGDWWNYGCHRYGRREQAAEQWGLAPHTCDNCGSVAARFHPSRRREDLPFSHHAEVAFLPEHEADDLLDWCADGRAARGRRWSIQALRQEKYRREQAKFPPPTTRRIGLVIQERSDPPTIVPRRPRVSLDASPAGGPVASELLELQEEPAPVPDRVARVAMANAGLDHLTKADHAAVLKTRLRALTDAEFDTLVEECQAERYGYQCRAANP
jgi:hypothetical protein